MNRRPGKDDRAPAKGEPGAPDADVDDFTRAMADVVRLAPDPRGRVRAAPPVTPPRAAPPSTSPARRNVHDTDDGSEAAFVAPGVDRRELRKLKRGDYARGKPFSRLDLHGQTAAEAVASVTRFLDTARHCHRLVCVVHGRGLHSEGNVAILKTRVRERLRRHPAVLAYADAPPADGGSGAVYVLLRK